MGTFSKIKKFSKPSHKIDEKIENLNQSIKKLGLMSETMSNSTSGLYSVTQYNDAVPAVPPTYSNVPDSSGVTGNSFVQNDITNDNTGYNDSSQLFNPNIGENPTPIVYTPPEAAALGGAGVVVFQGFIATILGYIDGENYFRAVISTSNPYFYYPDQIQLSPLQAQYLPYFQYIYNTPSKSWSAWVTYSEYDFGAQAIIKSTPSGTYALRGVSILNIPNTYQSNPGSPYQPPSTTVLQRTDLGDPNYFPGPAQQSGDVAQMGPNELNTLLQIIKGTPGTPDAQRARDALDRWAKPGSQNRENLIKMGVLEASLQTKGGDIAAVYGGEAELRRQELERIKQQMNLPPGKGWQGRYDQFGREYDVNTGKLLKGV